MFSHFEGEEAGLERHERMSAKRLHPNRHRDGAARFHHFAGVYDASHTLSGRYRKAVDNIAALISNRPVATASMNLLNDDSEGHVGVPAGYTYLFQLAAHDLVHTEDRSTPGTEPNRWPVNRRLRALQLETLYGGGSTNCPAAYALSQEHGPVYMRLGLNRTEQTQQTGAIFACPGAGHVSPSTKDIPRICGMDDGVLMSKDPLIADARNDDNLLLSQTVVLWTRVHNAVTHQLAARHGADLSAAELFRLSRDIVVMTYRRILVHDLLSRILDEQVWRRYFENPGAIIDDEDADDSVAFEFAYGAARLGHSMVRPGYKTQEGKSGLNLEAVVDTTASHSDPAWLRNVPIHEFRALDWRLFFDLDQNERPEAFQWALRFGPHIAKGIEGSQGKKRGELVMRRDLRRALNARSAPVQALVNEMMARAASDSLAEHYETSANLSEIMKSLWSGPHDFLNGVKPPPMAMSQDDIKGLMSKRPPLPLYLACEAVARGGNGRRMGPIASTLVAEAFAAAFNDRNRPEDYANEYRHVAQQAADIMTAGGEAITNMPALIAFLEAAEPHYEFNL